MKLVILDRDGVINHDSDQFIKSPDEFRPIPGSAEAIARLNHSGYHVVVATNQSGVGRGLFDMATLNAINEKMNRIVTQAGGRLDAVFYCPCAAEANCDCRKPRPGMFHDIGQRFGIDHCRMSKYQCCKRLRCKPNYRGRYCDLYDSCQQFRSRRSHECHHYRHAALWHQLECR